MSCFGVCSFSRPRELNTLLADDWFGQLSISRQLGAEPPDDADPMTRLELELKAGLSDRDHDRVLDSIRMLGNLRHLQSNAELISLLDSPDELVQTYVFEAMLRLVLPDAATAARIATCAPVTGRLYAMQIEEIAA